MRTMCDLLEALLHDEPLCAHTHDNNRPSFVVKVVEDDGHPLSLFTKRVRDWHPDLVERHERRTRCRGVRGFDRLSG